MAERQPFPLVPRWRVQGLPFGEQRSVTVDGEVEPTPQGFPRLGATVRTAQCRTEVGQRTGLLQAS